MLTTVARWADGKLVSVIRVSSPELDLQYRTVA